MAKTMTALLILVAFAFLGCASKASPEEIQKMCTRYLELTGADKVPAKAELTADVERMFAQLKKDSKASHDLELKQVSDDIQARLAEAKDEAEKTSLNETLESKKKQLEDKMTLDVASFESRKVEELAKVDAKIKAAGAERDAAFKKCVDKANTEEVTSSLAQCRIGAQTVDKYNTVCY